MTTTLAASHDTLPVAWWLRRGTLRPGSDDPIGMLLWRDPEAGTQLVAAHRSRSGVLLSADHSVLMNEARQAFTAATPTQAYSGVTQVAVEGGSPTYDQLLALIESPPAKGALYADVEANADAALAHTASRPAPQSASNPAQPSAPAEVADPVVLADGRIYQPRPIAGSTDVQLLRQARGALFTRIVGTSGNGKTMLAQAAFGDDLIVVEGHGALSVDDLVGKWVPRDDGPGYRFAYGPLAEAMRQGKVLLIDDLTRAPSDTVNVLMGPADDRRMLVIDALPDEPVLHAAEGFHIVATYNRTGVAVRPVDEAIMRRLPLEIEVTTDYGLVSSLGVDPRLVQAGRLLAARASSARDAGRPTVWAPQTDHLLKAQKALDMGLGDHVAASMLLAACPEPQHLPQVRDVLIEVFGHDVGPLVQQEQS
ncbi:AAA family ATPase [Dietzia sp. 179-F 9C3 NHS]|uniref:AAA family ATPase n=1 Tax=Dietzia sp. 179-F 9C3 NHS TaxID=3374295 RepID=UPI003879DD73